MTPFRHTLERLHAVVSEQSAVGEFCELHVEALEEHDRRSFWALAGANEPWDQFRATLQSCFEVAAGPAQFAALVLARGHQRFSGHGGENAPAADEEQLAEALETAADEFIAVWRKFKEASGKRDRLDDARSVLESSQRLASVGKLEGIRAAAAWLVEKPNAAERGRRATAFVWALFDSPTMFQAVTGGGCARREEIAPAQGFTDRRLRDLLHELAERGLVARGYESAEISNRPTEVNGGENKPVVSST